MAIKFFTDESGNAVSKKLKGVRVDTVPVHRDFIPIKYYDSELELSMDGAKGYSMIFDIECYKNYFLIGFKCIETQKYVEFEITPDSHFNLDKLNWLVWNFRLIGFNSRNYDMTMLFLALRGYGTEMLRYYSNRIIQPGVPQLEKVKIDPKRDFKLTIPHGIDHIDIQEVCPVQGSLKKYSARLHAKRLQELPFDVEKILTFEEAQHLKNYCLGSDIVNTELLFNELSEQFKLRYDMSEKYKIDLRSKSDAQIAEAVIKAEVKRKTGREVKREIIGAGTTFSYIPPKFLKFDSVGMKAALDTIRAMTFEVTEKGNVTMPDSLKEMLMPIGQTKYKLGKGGIHSQEKCASYVAKDGMILVDIDVASFYPKLILNSGLYPEAIGPVFLEIFEEIVNRRLTAKANAKTVEKEIKSLFDKLGVKYKKLNLEFDSFTAEADGLKITINGTFGKLGSKWSIMYAPDLLLQVTITGQLSLLMIIERMEAAGLQCVSANTDGIVLYIHESKYDLLNQIKNQWCKETNLEMEETRYSSLYTKDVNNYYAVKLDGNVKSIGAYKNPWADKKLAIFRFHKNPMRIICIEAVTEFLVNKKPIETTIRECRDIRKFVCAKDVAGGAHKNGVYLGGTVRWYYAQDERDGINYVNNNALVGESLGGKPLMDFPDSFPEDIDYSVYIEKAQSILFDIGFYQYPKTLELF